MPARLDGVRALLARLSPTSRPTLWICGTHIAVALLLFDPKPFVGGDNFWYMLLGESLRSGEGYRDIWLPDAPLHTRFPPIYPTVLAGLGLIANSVLLFKLFSLACTTAIAALTYRLALDRTSDQRLAFFAGLLAAFAAVLVEYSHWVLSEPLFAFLVTLAVYAFAREEKSDAVLWFAVGTAAAILAALTRSAGYALLPAILVTLGYRRRWKRLGLFVVVTGLAVGGWWLRNRMALSGDLPYTQWLLFRDPYNPELGTISLLELGLRLLENLEFYTFVVLPESIGGRDLGGWLSLVIGLILAITIALGAFRQLRKLQMAEVFFFVYLGLILLWPGAWADQRLLLPLLPVAIIFLLEALYWAVGAGKAAEGSGSLRFRLPATLCVLFAAFGNLQALPAALFCSELYWTRYVYACYPPEIADFMKSAVWAREHTVPEAIVVNRKPQVYYWYARRPGIVYPFTEDSDSVLRFIESQGATHVVLDTWTGTSFRYLLPAIDQNLERFELVHVEGDPPTLTLEVAARGVE